MGETEPAEGGARRRRTRHRETAEPPPPPAAKTSKAERDAERGLRGLVGAGPSQVGIGGALRARDASRPTDEDLATAEREVQIVRRHYIPTDPPPPTH